MLPFKKQFKEWIQGKVEQNVNSSLRGNIANSLPKGISHTKIVKEFNSDHDDTKTFIYDGPCVIQSLSFHSNFPEARGEIGIYNDEGTERQDLIFPSDTSTDPFDKTMAFEDYENDIAGTDNIGYSSLWEIYRNQPDFNRYIWGLKEKVYAPNGFRLRLSSAGIEEEDNHVISVLAQVVFYNGS